MPDTAVVEMTRADMLQEVIVDGLLKSNQASAAAIVAAAQFELDPLRDRVVAFCPRSQFNARQPASDDAVQYLRDSIETGLQFHGFADIVWIEP